MPPSDRHGARASSPRRANRIALRSDFVSPARAMARSGSLGYRPRMLRRRLQQFGYPMLGLLFLVLHGIEIAGDETLSTVEVVGAGAVAVLVAVAVAFAGRAPLVLAAVTLA